MEQDKKNLLEIIDRPAFLVRDDVVCYANQLAKNRQIREGANITQYLTDHLEEYRAFRDGCLYLTTQIGYATCGATVTKQADGHLFLLDRDTDISQLQALSLAGQQLRMPLSNVLTLTDQLSEKLSDDPCMSSQTQQLSRSLHQMLRIVSNMADAERYMGLLEPNMELTNLEGFLHQIVEKAIAMLDGSVEIRYEGLTKRVYSLVDRERLERSVYNLLSNAVKFSPKGSVVEIKAAIVGEQVRISVEDHGEGIADSVKGSLFYRYQREAAIEDSRFGLGLGMTLVRTTAAVHGGTVLIDQPNGTRVTMSIAIRKTIQGGLHSPILRISDYLGGRDSALVELSDALPSNAYRKKF